MNQCLRILISKMRIKLDPRIEKRERTTSVLSRFFSLLTV
jgi:hypothetical protein